MGIIPKQICRGDAIDVLKMWRNPKRKDILVKAGVEEKNIQELRKIFNLK